MRVPYRWLAEWVKGLPAPEVCAEALIRLGHEVEGIEQPKKALLGVVIGQILRIEPHPNADRLKLLSVSVGPGEPLSIVCGATNMQQGDKVAVATVGARLPGGMEIRRARIRGVESFGMCCSARELGLGEDASGLWILPEDAPVGAPLADWLELDEAIFELSITPNRGDCMSVRGIARELAADFDLPLASPPEAVLPEGVAGYPVRVEDEKGCPFYAAVRIDGIKPQPLPAKMRRRLADAGLREVHPVVDVLNLLMIELGQPMHAFDADALASGLVVRSAAEGERFVAIDGREYTLKSGDLVVADESGRVQALAGIIGAKQSEVGAGTTSIVLESAFFLPARISLARQRLGCVSEAALRFERGVDPEMVERALAIAANEIVRHCGGTITAIARLGSLDAWLNRAEIVCALHRIHERLGFEPPVQTDAVLTRMGFSVKRDGDQLHVRPPAFRHDIAHWWDIAEEYGRIAGLEAVPTHRPLLPARRAEVRAENPVRPSIEAGCSEVVLLAFSSPELERHCTPEDGRDVRLANPLAETMSILRRSLVPKLAEAAAENLRRGVRSVRLVECARVHRWEDDAPVEERRLAWCFAGLASDDEWFAKARAMDFFDLKGVLEHWFARFGHRVRFEADDALLGFQPGQAARVLLGKLQIGRIGRLSDALLEAIDAPQPIFAAEIVLDALPPAKPAALQAPAAHPAIVRDLVFVVPRQTMASELVAQAKRAAGALAEEARIFDRYEGKGVPEGMISLGLRLVLRAPDRTLTQQEAEAIAQRVIEACAKLGAKLRV